MCESKEQAIVLDVCDILDRLGLKRESITELLETGAKLIIYPTDQLVPNE